MTNNDELERQEVVTHECGTCSGLGTIDERLGGYAFSNPKASCPDCDGMGEWYESAKQESNHD